MPQNKIIYKKKRAESLCARRERARTGGGITPKIEKAAPRRAPSHYNAEPRAYYNNS